MNKKLLNKLTNAYGFTYDTIGCYIRINSKRDSYYILDIDYDGHKIELYHQNTCGNSYMHSHGKHKSLDAVFKCIDSHDNRETINYSKKTKLSKTFELVHQQLIHNV